MEVIHQQVKNIIVIMVITALILLHSCKNENEQLSFNVDIDFINLVCYPNDSISTTFVIAPSGGKAPYMYNWINPGSFVGEGPFTMHVKNNIMLELEVVDANNTNVKFQYEIIKDTIDPLKYDYRNAFAGFYDCDVNYRWVEDSNGTWISHHRNYQDTIEVIKNGDFQMINISTVQPDLNFNYNDSTFRGYHTSGKFHNDSIAFNYFATPVALYSWDYKGGKIKQF